MDGQKHRRLPLNALPTMDWTVTVGGETALQHLTENRLADLPAGELVIDCDARTAVIPAYHRAYRIDSLFTREE